ncbi:serine/threonine-protein kinase [Leptolyngbya ohadii]|uniref:serine/threonine-protein kinase n=1 Tax=Leptolyngbya ohadii TaxID=1962290 RepID=UPI000B59CF7F|nr:serine/threonine-protein kinase [Leptolyngbya ohadii]
MSLCINPRCHQPDHPGNGGNQFCQSCGSELVLQGRYRVMRLLSDKSGFGKVYEAFERSNPKILKILKDNYSDNEKAVELFQQEALVLSQLHHPGIPAIEPDGYFQYKPRQGGERQGGEPLHCIVMEKIDGPNLREWMRQQGNHPIGEKQARQWLQQLAEILHLVHERNYFHRDIKPENIMLRSTGQVVLVDFGAAREMTYTYLEQLGKTGGITRISSAGYTPPEQEKGQAVPQSDFYALGCTFIYLLTGKQPTDNTMYDSLNNEFHWRPFAPQVSPAFADFIDRLIAPRASDRPKNTRVLLESLRQLDQVPVAATASTLLQSTVSQPIIPPTAPGASAGMVAGMVPGMVSSNPSGNPLGNPLVNPLGTQPQMGSGIPSGNPSGSPSGNLLGTTPGTAAVGSVPGAGFTNLPRNGMKRWLWGIPAAILLGLGGYSVWYFIDRQNPVVVTQPISIDRTLSGHTSFVNAVIITPDGKTLISGSADNTIRLWDMNSGRLIRTLSGHTSFVNNALALSPDGQTLISGSADRTIRVWDLTTGKLRHTLLGHTGFVNSVDVSPDGKILASGGADNTVKIWDLATAKLVRTLTGHQGYVNSVIFTPDGQSLVSGSTDRTVRVWDWTTGTQKEILKGHTGFVNSVVITPDGETAISSSADKTIRIWNLSTGETLHTVVGNSFFNPLILSADGQTLVSGSSDGAIQIWRVPEGQLIETLTGYGADIQNLTISPDWQTIASGSGGNTIKIWKFPRSALR